MIKMKRLISICSFLLLFGTGISYANSFGMLRFGNGFAIGDLLRPLLSGGQANNNAYGNNSGMLCHCPNGAMHGQCEHFHCHHVGSHATERASGKEALLNALPNVWYDVWFSR